MFIKGNCANYIDKNLRVYENSTGIFVLCLRLKISYFAKNFSCVFRSQMIEFDDLTDRPKWGTEIASFVSTFTYQLSLVYSNKYNVLFS